ncbi:16S rRNA m(2)G 1207 methyltransferase /23S rRNA m(2)G-1835 methyltransferase [Klenkia soli]|uniref:16S rRNA m(2)G 1207 methyltransferase /23S rRNA m(2)G-1835 methyltransferase n=1 Tax=Klenkia soli TaxID=1052260 RepID=A0A1H0QY69_9ACTN|nr:class I SAM-dependent methyltransferase [Klenkia soli]SDP21698.1 16S rRNA m(2)G 1207 methyltransferase /23S rRNA m(2)G-1835 methyltransferase [Klenkia soli]
MPDPFLDQLSRFPDVEAPDLVAVDATDRLLLDEAAAGIAAHPDGVLTVDDTHGALTLGAVALHGASGVRAYTDLRLAELALAANAERTGTAGFTVLPELDAAGARVVLVQAPKSLDALREIAETVAAGADRSVTLYVGGRVKHMTHAMNGVLGDSFEHVHATLARQKSRVLVATGPRPGASSFPRVVEHPDLGITVAAHGAAFAGTKVDIGTRALLRALPAQGSGAAVDLGCGTGVLAVALARAGYAVLASDASAAAVLSARATAERNGVADRVTVVRDDALAGVEPGSVDLVACNPPFHQGTTVHAGIADRLFEAAARVLRPGGQLLTVYNSHLPHRDALRRVVGPTRQVSRDPKFTVTASTKL